MADRSAWRPAAGAMGCEGDALTDAWQLCLTLVVNWSDCRYNGHWATGARVRKQRSLRPCLHRMRLTRLLSLLHLEQNSLPALFDQCLDIDLAANRIIFLELSSGFAHSEDVLRTAQPGLFRRAVSLYFVTLLGNARRNEAYPA